MIVVDTSVWIDVLNETSTPKATRCISLLEDGAPLALTDTIFTEVLQGFSSDQQASRVERHLRVFPVLRLETLEDFALAAELYRKARRSGITIRRTLDCLIASPCIREGASILHSDQDFDRLASCTPLKIFE